VVNWKETLAPGWNALRRFWLPFCLIELFAALLVTAYYRVEAVHDAFEVVARWKASGGLLFSMTTTMLAGAVLPELAKMATGSHEGWTPAKWKLFGFTLLFFAGNGGCIDLFYRFQGWCFGRDAEPTTVAVKVLADMLLFTPFIVYPVTVTVFLFRSTGWRWRRVVQAWGWPLYRDQVLPLLLPGWAYWFPMVACIYALPSDLQIPLFLLALSAWSLIFLVIATRHDASDSGSSRLAN
jgi:hypothetical protein